VFVEAAGDGATTICRNLHGLRLGLQNAGLICAAPKRFIVTGARETSS